MSTLTTSQRISLIILGLGLLTMLGGFIFNLIPTCDECGANIGAGLVFFGGASVAMIGTAALALSTLIHLIGKKQDQDFKE